jgi:NAD(P)-dependent dehydrogenase (short-subunit alcohol dehydrogenase family)
MAASEVRAAIVTGATGGIGHEIVAGLAARKAAVVAVDVAPEITEVQTLAGSAPVHALQADLSDPEQCLAAVVKAQELLGDIDVLINNAGLMLKKPLAEHTLDDWDLEMAVNARAPFLLCRELVPSMASRGWGLVVNLASIWASRGGSERAAHVAAKHAVLGLTRALAAEYGPAGVRVNAVSSGPVRTPMTAPSNGDQKDWLDPREVAEVVLFLCSEAAVGIQGADIEIAGRVPPGP